MSETRQGRKKIVVCCDGTGNQFGGSNSNVVKLYTCLTINNDQVGYYHPGVGTMGAPHARTPLGEKWSVIKGLAFGAGFMDNVEDAYRFLMETYNDGDEIYLFGFSRGSYTARALAAILHAYGLLCKGNGGQVPYLLKLFNAEMKQARKQKGKTSLDLHAEFKETFSHNITLRFVGLWDTVSSVGWFWEPVRLLYSAQNPIIECGRHAISIDERRCSYRDNLWGDALELANTPSLRQKQDILQIWFAGAHSDVGGSYKQSESALSNVTLEWLLAEAEAAGVLVEQDRVRMIFSRQTEQPHAAAHLYRPSPDQPGKLHNELARSLAWWLLELLPQRAYDNDDGKEKLIVPLGRTRTLPDGSILHWSVVERLGNPLCNYKPANILCGAVVPHQGASANTRTDLSGHFLYRSPLSAPRRHPKHAAAWLAWLLGLGALTLGALVSGYRARW